MEWTVDIRTCKDPVGFVFLVDILWRNRIVLEYSLVFGDLCCEIGLSGMNE